MRYLLALIAVVFLATCSQQETPSTPDIVTVNLTPAGGVLEAEWRLPEPVTEFIFYEDPMPYEQRLADWIPAGDGWKFDGGMLTREDGAAFDSFTLNLSPIKAVYDRKYVPVARAGDGGWIVFADALAPLGASHQVSFEGFPEGTLIYGGGVVSGPHDIRDGQTLGIFYAGPAEYVHQDGGVLIAGPEIPESMKTDISASLDEAIEKLTAAWGYAPETPPAVIITAEKDWNGQSWKGGVREEVITFHIRGFDLDDGTGDFSAHIRNIALHEAIHVWNGTLFESAENSEQSWVHEGGAEYIANRLWMSDARFASAVQAALNGCILNLGTASIRETEIASRGSTPYECGHIVHLAAELSALKQHNGNVLDIWKAVYDAAGKERVYDSNTFVTAATAAGGDVFGGIMSLFEAGLDSENVEALVAELNSLGADIVLLDPAAASSGDTKLSFVLLRKLLNGYCQGANGFTQMEDGFHFDTGDRCGDVLNGDPVVATLNGHDLIASSTAAYFAAREACEAGAPLVLTALDGAALAPLACPVQVAALPAIYEVRSAGMFPEL